MDNPLPVAVYIHGGAWTGGDKEKGEGVIDAHALVADGYIVVSTNYRLAPTYRFPVQMRT